MPRENKKRGRREAAKRKLQDDHDETSPKRQRFPDEPPVEDGEFEIEGEAGDDFIRLGYDESSSALTDTHNQFYGLLEPEEQEYYVNVNNKITANDFESDEDRALFLDAVHRETKGKEIKVASSQSCSRYLEKIIMLSTAEQLESLFSAFLQNLTYLVQHRFGSHCCETLFLRAADYVDGTDENVHEGNEKERESLELMYLQAAEQLQSNIGFMLTERFASHTIRMLLLVLSGESLHDESTKSMLASRRKEKLDAVSISREESPGKRKVPDSFRVGLSTLVTALTATIDATYLRALATHPVGNPVLQLLLQLDLTAPGKSTIASERTLLAKLLPSEDLGSESESGKFILGLIYDPAGSHLIEVLVQHSPGKLFKKLYKTLLRDRMGNLSKNDTASYVAIKVLERLGKDDLADVIPDIVKEIPGLINRSRTGMIKVVFERCAVRQVDTKQLTNVVRDAYGGNDTTMLPSMMKFPPTIGQDMDDHKTGSIDQNSSHPPSLKADVHGCLLAQTMLQVKGACDVVQQSILAQPLTSLLSIAKNPMTSRVLQEALKSETSQIHFRRQLIPRFYGHMAELAIDPAGSHVTDALWDGTDSLHFMKEKLAKEMQENESELRNSVYGRTVWRNWAMDMYLRRSREWQMTAKGHDQEALPDEKGSRAKTAIELARQRHATKVRRTANANTGRT